MDKVLIVDDDKMLSKVIEKKVREIGFTPICAYTMEMAKECMQRDAFFAALLDLNLPDAPNGEIVDVVLFQKIPTIVLTSMYDDDIRINMTAKPIVDYVIKNREESISYAVNYVKKLKSYSRQKALVVEDSLPQRSFIKRLTEALLFEVYEAQNGLEALEVLKQYPDIKLVITDYHMPEMDGYELTIKLRKTYKEDSMAIIALTGHDSKETSSKFLKFGASDYLAKPFTKEEFNYRITKKMDVIEMLAEIRDYSEKLEFANDSIRHANAAKLKYIQTIEEYLDIIDRHVLITRSDNDGVITYASNAFLKLAGYEWSEVVGKQHSIFRHPDMPQKTYKELWDTILSGRMWSGELKNRKKNGEIFWAQTTISPILDENRQKVGYVAFRNDTTDRVIAQNLAQVDPLTKVYNRLKFDNELKSELARFWRYKSPVSVLLIDIDDFGRINERFGSLIGDKVLMEIGKMIQMGVRTTDIVARFDGEQFGVILTNTGGEGAATLADRLRDTIEKSLFLNEIRVTVSIGIAEAKEREDRDGITKKASMALGLAKELGKNRAVLYGDLEG